MTAVKIKDTGLDWYKFAYFSCVVVCFGALFFFHIRIPTGRYKPRCVFLTSDAGCWDLGWSHVIWHNIYTTSGVWCWEITKQLNQDHPRCLLFQASKWLLCISGTTVGLLSGELPFQSLKSEKQWLYREIKKKKHSPARLLSTTNKCNLQASCWICRGGKSWKESMHNGW